jgi:hypothetical protein
VKVHRNEGVAIHIGPESCAGSREAVREALTGEHAGQPLSREKGEHPGADTVPAVEGNTNGRDIASARFDPAWSQTLACMDAPCTGTGRPRDWPERLATAGPHRKGEEP